jgi:hypothetical protein
MHWRSTFIDIVNIIVQHAFALLALSGRYTANFFA